MRMGGQAYIGTSAERGGPGIRAARFFYESDTGLTYIGNEAATAWLGPTSVIGAGGGAANRVTWWLGPNTLTSNANLTYNPAASPNLLVIAANAAHTPLAIRATAAQASDLTNWQNSGGNVVGGVDERGVPFCHLNTAATNYFAGDDAGNTTMTAINVIAIGQQAADAVTTGDSLIAIGSGALTTNTIGTRCVAIGVQALGSNLDGNDNFGCGYYALQANSSGDQLTALGSRALQGNTTGSNSVGIGWQAGRYNQTGGSSVCIGAAAGLGVVGNSYSTDTFIGTGSGQFITTGSGNTCVGYRSGRGLTTGGYNVFIGFGAAQTQETVGSYKLYIESSDTANPLIYGEFDNDLVRLNGDTALTNTIHPMLYKRHQTSNTAAALFGIGTYDELEDGGGNAQVASEVVTLWATPTSGSESPLRRWTTYPEGNAGPGYGGIWTWPDVDNNARTVIPNGAGDVVRGGRFTYCIYLNTAAAFASGSVEATPGGGAVDLYNVGGDQFTLTVAADGSVTVVRAAGADTADIVLWPLWISS